EADGHLIVLEVIEERAAIGAAVERPADGVDDRTLLVIRGRDLPQLLDAEREGLGIDTVAQLEALEQGLGEGGAAALGEQRVGATQLDAGLEVVGRLTVLADAHVAGGDAEDAAVLAVEHLGGSEARIDLDAKSFGLGGQPAAEVAEADDVVAVVVHLRWGG